MREASRFHPRLPPATRKDELPQVAFAAPVGAGPTLASRFEMPDHAPPAQPAVVASLSSKDFTLAEQGTLPDRVSLPVFRPAPAMRAALERPAAQKPAITTLAYARPDNPIEKPFGNRSKIPWPGTSKKVAVYDISAGRVYMPNGDVLEAHSGIGKMRDNPKYAHVTMRGPTPPSTYKLTMREALFHGVEAIRMTPVDGVAPLGRVGILAHSYLLRVPGDSHGCVAFKDYKRFLTAFKRGEITQMIVVSSAGAATARSLRAPQGTSIASVAFAPKNR